jgi:hypothetical protein
MTPGAHRGPPWTGAARPKTSRRITWGKEGGWEDGWENIKVLARFARPRCNHYTGNGGRWTGRPSRVRKRRLAQRAAGGQEHGAPQAKCCQIIFLVIILTYTIYSPSTPQPPLRRPVGGLAAGCGHLAGRPGGGHRLGLDGPLGTDKGDAGRTKETRLDSGGNHSRIEPRPLCAPPTPDTAPWGYSPDIPVWRDGDPPNERGWLVQLIQLLRDSLTRPLTGGGVHRP